MPLYEYTCSECGYRFELLVRGDTTVPDQCPSCSARALKKEFSTFAVSSSSTSSKQTDCGNCSGGSTCPFAGSCAGGTDD